ncbi:hypothetical protein K2173_018420 [Erythroxylum novogranatense]|uniref:Carbohydrate kinase PfkB domain-containing protein n=1 Tax=Erythroxylum novogranatense TaxID=1862640 RepID=A0AAV8UD90_9ROSI|nr:hypothetical protein K2173_018420 [Erythroxylum novogranatense]
MHNRSLSFLESSPFCPFHGPSSLPFSPPNPCTIFPISSSSFTCKGTQLSMSITRCATSLCPANGWKLMSVGGKHIDVSTLGNLCVDVILNVPELPPRNRDALSAYMERLAASPPDKRYLEAGGNCNVAIAAARLGLRCATIGLVGDETYGNFLLGVLRDEGISMVGMQDDDDVVDTSSALYETLLCWVLVDPLQRHGFCSRADFHKEPALSWMRRLSVPVKAAIKQSRTLFCNGYGFDELSPGLLTMALDYAVEVGTSVFFDPGPRGKKFSTGTPEQQETLTHFLKMSDVLLLTADEAESLTGIRNPVLAGKDLLLNGVRTKWVIVKMGSKGSILVTMSSISCAPAFKVNVIDTVGCGDSFDAAIAFGFINNMPLINTLAIANAVGAATAMGCGAGRNVATLDKVIELMRASNIHEDDKYWNELLPKDLENQDITFLSGMVPNGSHSQLSRVPLQKVVTELLPQLVVSTLFEGKVAC